MNKIKVFWKNYPLKSIIILAFLVRLIAVFFSAGYAFHDDHFLIVEAAQSWVGHEDWNDWLPEVQLYNNPDEEPVPQGHSLLYPNVHFVLFKIMKYIGIHSPEIKMILIRLIHALFSLIVVFLGYKMTLHYTDKEKAKAVGLFLALLWFMPFLSVRNLVEIVCIPFLMLGLWLVIKNETNKNVWKPYILAGIYLGIAFSVRFQTIVFAGGIGLVLLFQKKWKETIILAFSVLFSIALIQGVLDIIAWGKPFVEFIEYVKYNLQHKSDYGNNVWYMYTTILGGLIIPPLGVFLFIGWFLTIRKYPLLFWPAFLFFMLHNYFPNKQERFILPIISLFVISGVIGWWSYMDKSKFWTKNKWLFKVCMIFFWVLNFIALPVFSTTYSKKSRCETMAYIGAQEDAKRIIVEESIKSNVTMLPTFYAGKDIDFYHLGSRIPGHIKDTTKFLKFQSHITNLISPDAIKLNNWPEPQYIAFINEKKLEERVANMKEYYPTITLVKTIYPGYIDMLMRKITPSNNNQLVFIYKIK